MKDIYKTKYKIEKYYLRNNTSGCLRECKRKVPYKVKLSVKEVVSKLTKYFKNNKPSKELAWIEEIDTATCSSVKPLDSTKYTSENKDMIDYLNECKNPSNSKHTYHLAALTSQQIDCLHGSSTHNGCKNIGATLTDCIPIVDDVTGIKKYDADSTDDLADGDYTISFGEGLNLVCTWNDTPTLIADNNSYKWTVGKNNNNLYKISTTNDNEIWYYLSYDSNNIPILTTNSDYIWSFVPSTENNYYIQNNENEIYLSVNGRGTIYLASDPANSCSFT